jgi:glutathione synthase/RimK-type ligase-like ATP-grasp enzyme
MFTPPFPVLISLHNKWEFSQLVEQIGLDVPPTVLCKSRDDFLRLDLSNNKEYALKPVFGRALSGMYHHKPGKELPDLPVSEDIQYIAQEWIYGTQLCSYCVSRNGEIKASSVYPVIDTIDGSSCVYFQSIEHPKIKNFMETFARTYNITGQMAFDFIETPEKLYVIECNPRATSGIHLFKHTSYLSDALTNPLAERHDAPIGNSRQVRNK